MNLKKFAIRGLIPAGQEKYSHRLHWQQVSAGVQDSSASFR